MKYKYPLASTTWDQAELDAMQRVISSGIFSMGEEVLDFETDFAEYIGSKYAVMSNSGSSANLLMVAALFFTQRNSLKPGDEVIVPAVSWSTTYYPLHQYGLRLRFVDIDLETLNYDLDALEQAITGRTRLIMVVNLLGNPNDFKRIQDLIKNKDIRFIEDNCESLGAEFNGRKAGTFGTMGSFSSFFSHHISTMEGGLTVTDDEELYQIMLSLRAHGWTRNLPKYNLVCGTKSDDQFDESFRFVLPGYNLRPLELSGAIGKEQVKKLPSLIVERRKNAELFQRKMGDHPDFIIQREIGRSSWFGFSLVIRPYSNLQRKSVIKRLNHLGFECRPIVGGNFTKNEVMKYIGSDIYGELKNADNIDRNGIFIGNHHYQISDSIEILAEIKNWL
ncbi:DegT/DnrJ/EryC1/StrS family aminotransferase [Burkholderiaceae bacterium]|nr:DegT/DnrJ/EryC1/StrS family aminotransferase [Burkholderiaceae bacterium]